MYMKVRQMGMTVRGLDYANISILLTDEEILVTLAEFAAGV